MLTKLTILALTIYLTTGLCGLVYLVGQQNLRQNANDPQVQLSEDLAQRLATGQTTQAMLPSDSVPIATSLAPYIIIYNDEGQSTYTTASLHGQTPTVPAGVLDFARKNGQDRLTWQPQPEVRSAIVVTHFGGASSGFVLAGRSLREVEVREQALFMHVFLAWFVLMAGIGCASCLLLSKSIRKDRA